jgi:hypothetical protein
MSRKRKSGQVPPAETPTAVAELPVATVTDAPPLTQTEVSFVERVGGKKEYTKPADPFGIAKDNLAGVRLFESKEDRQMAIKFGDGTAKDKPPQPVIDKLKEAGWTFDWDNRIWAHPVRPDNAMSIRIDAERLYQEVRQMIRQEKGIEATPDIPF